MSDPVTDDRLARLIDHLLYHRFDAQIVTGPHGTHGIALILDGWYSDKRNEYAIDAETALEHWQQVLDDLRAVVQEHLA